MTSDPAIDAIRRVRHEISCEAGHDLHSLKKTFEAIESQFKRRPVDYGGRRTIRGSDEMTSDDELPAENLSSAPDER